MPNITLSIPAEVHRMMRKYPEIRWSEVARRAIISKLEDLKRLDELTSDSRLEDKDVGELDHLVKRKLAGRYRRLAKKPAA
jgi:hypothetical protein